ncbi:MAG: hypothetical protein IPO85_18765 [Saprospiraceae bacterium]|uniref:Uncharacterized protein n=1 Tax=Candidatus Defluviibacterium haderslevense TaxID=2981993 RepID=A0A9D7XG97_9BACT|nr:hypothetical protein [Candidatus Defluviibacterium haderslevense]
MGIIAFTYDGKEIILGGRTKIRINYKSNDTVFISAIIRTDTFNLIVQNFKFRNSADFSIIRSNENSFLPSHYVNMRNDEYINFRNRPLNQNEIDIVNQDRYRNHQSAMSIDDLTFCFGLNDGMPVELINKLEKFSQIRVELYGKTYTGFIANKAHGISTLRLIND